MDMTPGGGKKTEAWRNRWKRMTGPESRRQDRNRMLRGLLRAVHEGIVKMASARARRLSLARGLVAR